MGRMIQLCRWFVLACVMVFLGVQWGCGGGSCSNCVQGIAQCTPDRKYVQTCEQVAGSGCWRLTLSPCQTGTCIVENNKASCQETCQPGTQICQAGQLKCQGNVVMICVMNTVTQCTKYEPSKVCQTGETCDPSKNACVKENCTPTKQDEYTGCVGNAVYWFDNCGNQTVLKQQCNADQSCFENKCQGGTSTLCEGKPACTEPGKAVCEGEKAFKTCEQKSTCSAWSTLTACPGSQTCKDGKCGNHTGTGNCDNPCPNKGDIRCSDQTKFQECIANPNIPNCLQWSAAVDCPNGVQCANNRCGTCESNCASEGKGTKLCSGAGYVECQEEAPGCLRWSTQQSCPNNGKCVNGKCEAGGSGTGGHPGDLGKTCSAQSECAGKCISKQGGGIGMCTKDCSDSSQCGGSGYVCVGLGSTLRVCLKACTSSSDCRTGISCVDASGQGDLYCLPG